MRLEEVEQQLKQDIIDFLILKLEKDISIKVTNLKYGNYVIYIHSDSNKNPYAIHATIGLDSSIMIYLTEEIIEYKTFLKLKKKTKVEKYTKLGKLIKENTSATITNEEEKKNKFDS